MEITQIQLSGLGMNIFIYLGTGGAWRTMAPMLPYLMATGIFREGANPQNTQTVLQSNKTIYKYSDAPLRLPVHITTSTEFTFLQNGSSIYNTTLDPSTNSNDIIRYVSSESAAGIQSWQDRVLLDSGTIESLDCVKDFLEDVDLYGVDTIYVDNGTTVEVYK